MEAQTPPSPAPATVQFLGDPRCVAATLAPIRRQLLKELREPDSASGLARRLGIGRQKLNYHLRELEKRGLLEMVGERQRRGFVERLYRVAAVAYVVDPSLLGSLSVEPGQIADRFSSAYLVSTAARLVGDVATLRQRAAEAGKKLLTRTLEAEVCFESPKDFQAFNDELTREVARLTREYAARGRATSRPFRIIVAAHPAAADPDDRTNEQQIPEGEKGR